MENEKLTPKEKFKKDLHQQFLNLEKNQKTYIKNFKVSKSIWLEGVGKTKEKLKALKNQNEAELYYQFIKDELEDIKWKIELDEAEIAKIEKSLINLRKNLQIGFNELDEFKQAKLAFEAEMPHEESK